ncbi:mitochondrial intermembrane space import and assembly protein 40 [[Candida] jaroonii]|uniref:Mitochondrial intermembrane space import and assembly protein 40 n=1 Tax=[Candida] jaroonii TaxID=467808 RepID=A0ACA9Y0E0_9ASCO|nr:mitochondrial intermembrane space import and assembly protein 40 [[Candida] jaroonii]
MFRTIIKNSVRSQVRRGYATSAYKPTKSLYAGIGLSLLTVPLIYGTISNEVKEKPKKKAAKKESASEAKEEPKEAVSESKEEQKESPKESETSETSENDKEPSAEDYEGAAYNPVTGEINWDCPCLGGMAHGPCGEEFKEAFACFVYSETEPKGIDCIKKFENMRTCFRRYPEHYKEQLEDEEQMEAEYNKEKVEIAAEPVESTKPAETVPSPVDDVTVETKA